MLDHTLLVKIKIAPYGTFDEGLRVRIFNWMKDNQVKHQYQYVVHQNTAMIAVEFEDENDAVLFKLTWSDYVR